MSEQTARQFCGLQLGAAEEELHELFRQPLEAWKSRAGLKRRPSCGVKFRTVAGGKNDPFAGTLPVRVSGAEWCERKRKRFRRNGQALEELQWRAVVAHPDAE
jgi:hypothetical protein